MAARALFPSRNQRQLHAARARLPPWPEAEAALPWLMTHGYRQFDALLSFRARPGVAWAVFVITLLLFGLSLLSHREFMAQLTLVVLVHELGHWAAMRVFGYRDPAIFFVPFFGAATTGTKHDASLGEQLTMLAAGPVPGLLAGSLALQLVPCPSAGLRELAILAIAVNGVNLLPIPPLDGGRILQLLAASKRPRLEVAMALAGVVVFFAVGIAIREPVFLVLGGVTLLAVRVTFEAARLSAELDGHREKTEAELLELAFGFLLRRKLKVGAMRQAVHMALIRLRAPRASGRQRLLGWSSYLVLLALAVSAWIPVADARRAARQEREGERFACALFTGPLHVPPKTFPKVALQLICSPAPNQDLRQLQADLSLLSDLPGELCLREPWVPVPKEQANKEERARRTVALMRNEGEQHRTYDYDPSDSQEALNQAIRADLLRAITAMEAWASTQRELDDSDFDAETAAAFLGYERARYRELADPQTEESAEFRDAEHALAALLGTRADCQVPTHFLRARMTKSRELRLSMFGDPRELASHFCAVGCEAVTVREPKDEAEDAPSL